MTQSAFSQRTADEASENDFIRFDKLCNDNRYEPQTKGDVQAPWPADKVIVQIERHSKGDVPDAERRVEKAEQAMASIDDLKGICYSSSARPIASQQ